MASIFESGNKRLLQLAKILDRVPAARPVKGGMKGYDQTSIVHPCGTPACAWGYWLYSNKGRFKRLAKEYGHSKQEIEDALAMWPKPGDGVYVSFYDAGRTEFCLNDSEISNLFESYGCGRAETGKQAAAYIRALVARRRTSARGVRATIRIEEAR